jgi:hydrogenase maturation protease
VTVLVGGVGELFQSDLDVGRHAVELLAAEQLGPGVFVEELHYGAVAVAQRLQELRPEWLLLIGAVEWGGRPGEIRRRVLRNLVPAPDDVQAAVRDAAVGYVGIDLLLDVCAGFGALPSRTVLLEVQPAGTGSGVEMSPEMHAALPRVVAMVRTELQRRPLVEVVEALRERCAGDRLEPSAALTTLGELLDELDGLDRTGRWGATFARRDRLRLEIAGSHTSESMEHLDWALWWALIEELDRLQPLDAGLRQTDRR